MLSPHDQRTIQTTVYLLSFSSLSFEVLLARVFAVSQWNYMVFMVLSIALLGFAAAGTFLNLRRSGKGGRGAGPVSIEFLIAVSLGYPVISTFCFIAVNLLPFDYFRLLQPEQMVYLLLTYVLLTVPFFLAGLVISGAYGIIPEKSGVTYLVSMTGSACGAILPAIVLPFIDEGQLVVLTAAMPLLAAIPAFRLTPPPVKSFYGLFLVRKNLLSITLLIGGAAILLILIAPPALKVRLSPYKALSQILQLPDSHIVGRRSGLTGVTTIATSPHVRFAPGLSLKFTGELPQQTAVYRDGDNPLVLYDDQQLMRSRFAAYTLSYSAYQSVDSPSSVLIVQNGGGLAVACARLAGIENITLVEEHAELARMTAKHYRSADVRPQTPRQFLRQSTGKYDVIHIENWGTSLPGTSTLNQEYLLTTDALTAYLEHLSEKGIILISRKLLLPPSDVLRLWASAVETMRAMGVDRPEDHLAVLRNWDTYVLLIFQRPLLQESPLFTFAEELNFDWVYLPNNLKGWFNRYFVFDEPFHSRAISRLAAAFQDRREEGFFESYFLDISPQSDDRPFPYRFLKWHRLMEMYRTTGGRLHAMMLSGEMIVAAVFVAAALLSATMMALPVICVRNSLSRPEFTPIVYFLSVGAGFMLIELYFIKRLVLPFGDPIISFTVVLTGMLVFSGIGGYLSQRLSGRSLIAVLGALLLALILFEPQTRQLPEMLLSQPLLQRYVLALAWLAVPGILAGIPFPLAMRHCMKTPGDRAHAWTANGCTSVLASIFAAQLAISQGIAAIMTSAALAYTIALLCAFVMRLPPKPESIHS